MVLSSFYTSILHLYFTHGVLWGVGLSLSYFPSFLIVAQHFKNSKRLSLATGVITFGGSLGTLTLSPGLQWMFNRFGLSTSFRILAAVQVVIIVCGMTYCPVKEDEVPFQETKKEKYFDWSICKNRALIVFIVALGFNMLGYLVPFVHLVSLIRGLELAKLLSVLFIVVIHLKSISDWPISPCNSSYPASVDHIRMIVTDFKTIVVNCIDINSKRDAKI